MFSGKIQWDWIAEPAPSLQKRTWRQHLGVLIPLSLIYFALAFYRIDHQSLWVDEVISAIKADPNAPFRGWFGGRGPLYPVMLRLWAKWGSSEFALRSFSAVVGGLTVCLAYLTGLQLCNRRVAQIGTALVATSPFLIWYSQEVRYISLMIAAALLATYMFSLALSARNLWWWPLYCGSLLLAIAAFVVNIILPVAHGLYLVCAPSRRQVLRQWVACQLLVFALFSWWANDGHLRHLSGYWLALSVKITPRDGDAAHVQPLIRLDTGSSRSFTWMALPYTVFAFSTGFSLGPSVRELQVSRALTALWPHAFIVSITSLLFAGLFILGVVDLWRRPDAGRLLIFWLAVPLLATLGVSALLPSLAYNVRYVAMSWPAYMFILAAGLASLRRPTLQISALAAVVVFHGLSLANYYFDAHYSREDARAAARYLETATRPGEIIVVVGNDLGLRYYYRGDVPVASVSRPLINKRTGLSEHLEKLNEEHERLWLVEIRSWEADPQGTVKAILDERYRLREQKGLAGVDIYAYQRR